MKTIITSIAALLLFGSVAFADSFRVTYTHRGLIKHITIQAESTAEARRVVKDMFPDCYVTGAHRVGKAGK